MARDHHHHHHHHRTSGPSSNNNNTTTTASTNNNGNTTTGGSSSGSSSRRHRIPNPPVPHAQPSLLQTVPPITRVSASAPPPASNIHRNGNKTRRDRQRTTTNHHGQSREGPAPETNCSNTDVQELPVEDPEAMDAKKGLNEWGAFGGGGTGGSGGTGTFGFGPLLFHHHGNNSVGGGGGDNVGNSDDEKTPSTSTVSRDPFEMDQLLMGDPISFNPLQAISWARLDGEPMEEDHDVDRSERERTPARAGNSNFEGDRHTEYSPGQAASAASRFQQVSHGEYSSHKVDGSLTSTSSTTMNAEVARRATSNSPYATYSDHSPVGNVSQTLSAVSLSAQTPEPTDLYSNNNRAVPVVPPPPPPPPGRVSETKASHGAGSRQRRQRHRQPRENKKSGSQPVITVPASHPYPGDPYQRQEYAFPPPPPPPPFPSSLPPQYHHSPAVFQPDLQHQQQQTTLPHPAYGGYAITEPYPPPPPPPPPPPGQQQQQFLLCLAPNCNARFRCEPELNAHYRAEHSFMCNWASCKSVSFTSNNALVWHVKAEHLLLCPVPGCCDRVFSSKKALDGHVRVN